jgi:glycosyltransferase involved in cell wall biosynthesis
VLRLGEKLGLKMPQDHQNWLDTGDIANLLELNGFEVVSRGFEMPLPVRIPLVSDLVNRFLGRLPLLRRLGIMSYVVARRREQASIAPAPRTVTVVVPCRNERGNVRAAVERTPEMGAHTEILFVDGASTDGTVEEIETLIEEYRGRRDIRLIHQLEAGEEGGGAAGRMLAKGKGDAVRKGFAAASGEVLMILDADLTVPPEQLPRFYDALVEGCGEMINGCRMIYPMEADAMRTLNRIANKGFGLVFSYLLSQRIKDTLCGTKVLWRRDWRNILAQQAHFGDFDPFGDFDLLFGAARQNLRIVEMPVHYRNRTYGDIKIERFRHGLLLAKMSLIAMRRIKFF